MMKGYSAHTLQMVTPKQFGKNPLSAKDTIELRELPNRWGI